MKLLDILLILLVAAAIPGVINRTRARLAGRKGIRFLQHLYDVRLLLRKGAVYSTTTSPLFRAVPSVYLGAALVAVLFIPVGDLPPVLAFDGDLIAFAYTLALGRTALILGAMDTGSPFEGMGASREAPFTAPLAELGPDAGSRDTGPADGLHLVRRDIRGWQRDLPLHRFSPFRLFVYSNWSSPRAAACRLTTRARTSN